jgi:hypothetical protein
MLLLFSATTETGFNPKVLQFFSLSLSLSLTHYSLVVVIFFGIRLKKLVMGLSPRSLDFSS